MNCVAVCCSMLQYVAVCCSMLQYVAVCCSMLQHVAVCCSMLQYVAACCSMLQHVAVCCSMLQYVAACCSKQLTPYSIQEHLEVQYRESEVVKEELDTLLQRHQTECVFCHIHTSLLPNIHVSFAKYTCLFWHISTLYGVSSVSCVFLLICSCPFAR